MSEEIEGNLLYKCRLCGTTFGLCVPDLRTAVKELTDEGSTQAYGQRRCTLTRIHDCERRSFDQFGIADCIGAHGYPDPKFDVESSG